ncbi:winged helix-turn-helix domain-containing protein [Saccharomonospora cyanea]|uniref:winged helix-turn-helix domain-containing protein n=1 Tax=Saccharomonospora cyanea TaxID=40989 RepID=UPI0005B8476B|nr:winged helix-turn-helix domain-containing protein [Saccharomonospora cyanea]
MPTPPFTPDPADPRYLYEQLADYIAEQIAAGELRPGDRLPAEREFGDVYGVSLGTGRRAVEILRERGLVVTKPITGTFVAKR